MLPDRKATHFCWNNAHIMENNKNEVICIDLEDHHSINHTTLSSRGCNIYHNSCVCV